MPMPSKITNGQDTGGNTVVSHKKSPKSSLSHRIRPKSRQSNTNKPIRSPAHRDQSNHKKSSVSKRASAISIGATRKRIPSPGKRASTAESETAGDEDEEENQLLKGGLVIPDTPSTKAPSGEQSDSKAVTSLVVPPVDTHPYQYYGQLNPAWNIPPLKENEKPMKAFCTSFKVPNETPADRAAAAGIPNAPVTRPTENAAAKTMNETEEEKTDVRSGPLVEIIDGEIRIKESSVVVVGGRQTTEDVDKELAADGAVVEEDAYGITATYTSFTNRMKTQHWKLDETRLFYTALRQCGTDFSTMEQMYESFDTPKSRRQLKSKYKRECKKNPKLIDMAMNPSAQIPLDLSLFGDLDIEKTSPTDSSSTKVSADKTLTGSSALETEATPIKTVSSGLAPVESNSNDKVEQDIDQIQPSTLISTNSKQEPLESVKVLEPEDGIYPVKKTENTVDEATGMVGPVSDVASSALVEPVVKEKAEDTISENVAKPIALFGVRKKTTQRPKFRAKPRPKKAKAKRPVK